VSRVLPILFARFSYVPKATCNSHFPILFLLSSYIAFALENHELKVVAFQTEKQHEKAILRLLNWLLKPIVQHSPPLYSRFVINLHDNATQQSVHATYPLFSVCKMDYYTDHQQPPPPSLLLSVQEHTNETATAAVQAYATDLFSKQPKEPRTGNPDIDNDYIKSKDLLVPWHFSLRFQSIRLWFWPLYNRNGEVPFRKRKNIISWRGSTTGPWINGTRFQLVKEFGGRGIHPLKSNNNTSSATSYIRSQTVTGSGLVNADFAFIKIVQQPEHLERLSSETYRFARHMFYREMQHNKYILDIDGNGTYSTYT
jgi:hypothetical protein